MDLFSLGFVLLIAIVSGAIAYAADVLGKKLGKKRLSLRFRRWSLRPKHVASLGTAGMGVVVSLLTIGFIAAVSRDAREWLVQGRGLLVERNRLMKDVQAQQEEEKLLRARNADIQVQLGSARDELRKSSEEARQAENRRRSLQETADRLQDEVDHVKGELTLSRASLAKTSARLTLLRSQIASVRSSLAAAQTKLKATNGELFTVRKQLDTANKSRDYVNQQMQQVMLKSLDTSNKAKALQTRVDELTQAASTLSDNVQSLRQQRDGLIAQLDEAERKTTEAKSEYDQVYAKLQQASEALTTQQAAINLFLDTAVKSSRQEPITYGAGEEVARVALPLGATQDDASMALTSLLRTARVAAESRGAKSHKAGGQTFAVADVFDRKDLKTGATLTADALKRAVVERAAGQGESQVLVATSSLNAFRGEPVALDIAVVPNPMVYRRNEVVAEARIDGRQPEDRILLQLSDFVGGKVRARAAQDHMIPRANTAAPFGEVPPLDVLALVRDVKRAGRTVRVQAMAESDTYAADPLRLEFRIK